jgi:hypothetical protein
MHIIVKWVQDDIAGCKKSIDNKKVFIGDEDKSIIITNFNIADSRLFIIINFDKKGCIWEVNERTSIQAIKIKNEQIQYIKIILLKYNSDFHLIYYFNLY